MNGYQKITVISLVFVLTACSMNKVRDGVDDEDGFLTVNAIPWGKIYINDNYIDSTPMVKHVLEEGDYYLAIKRDGFKTHEQQITVTRAQTAVYSVKLIGDEKN